MGSSYLGGSNPAKLVVKKVLRSILKSVYLLNITTLSQLRKDGHPSIYGHGGHNDMDCSHWCLAGAPDTWKQLLYVTGFLSHQTRNENFSIHCSVIKIICPSE